MRGSSSGSSSSSSSSSSSIVDLLIYMGWMSANLMGGNCEESIMATTLAAEPDQMIIRIGDGWISIAAENPPRNLLCNYVTLMSYTTLVTLVAIGVGVIQLFV
uniref:Uncharacterized protein n=1 Tax=Glossina brevipalpis TaxID=37001 RepID=A0A1A9W519_9MUSC